VTDERQTDASGRSLPSRPPTTQETAMHTTFNLMPEQFTGQLRPVAERGELRASLFRYASGVCAVRLENALGHLVLLPYQGQQIWDAHLCGRRLTMKSMFDAPAPTRDFLGSYGAFLLHCGATAMGVPGAGDSHPLHGELHSAPYQSAALVVGTDARGEYIGLTGNYRHTQAFSLNYVATPLVKLYAAASVFTVSMSIHNLKASPMPLMLLEHVNFIPVDGGRLMQTAHCDARSMRVRDAVPALADVPVGYRALVQLLREQPEAHLVLRPGQAYDPEIVLYLDYLSDANGWARTLQVHPDGSADLLRHRPGQLNHGVRWICRTADQDALGVEPCTAEVDGFSAETRKGHVRSLGGGQTFTCDLEAGVLDAHDSRQEQALIDRLLLADRPRASPA
jgi:hypothetical protein